jgi:hypothetical protein
VRLYPCRSTRGPEEVGAEGGEEAAAWPGISGGGACGGEQREAAVRA